MLIRFGSALSGSLVPGRLGAGRVGAGFGFLPRFLSFFRDLAFTRRIQVLSLAAQSFFFLFLLPGQFPAPL